MTYDFATRIKQIEAELSALKIAHASGQQATVYDSTVSVKDADATAIGSFTVNQSTASTLTIPTATTSKLGLVKVDDTLSSSSTNPVQNKIINTALGTKADTSSLATVATSGSFDDLTDKKIYFATCSTAADTLAKVATTTKGDFQLETGAAVFVECTYACSNSPSTLNVDGTGAVRISTMKTATGTYNIWAAGEVVGFVYDGTYFVCFGRKAASTSNYGLTYLTTSATQDIEYTSATPKSINQLAQNMIAGAPVYSASSTYAVGDRVRYGYYTYECTTAITTAEVWNANHWTALDSLQDQIDDKQDKLTAGSNISISGSTISATVPTVSATQVLTSGTKIGTVTVDGTDTDFYAPSAAAGLIAFGTDSSYWHWDKTNNQGSILAVDLPSSDVNKVETSYSVRFTNSYNGTLTFGVQPISSTSTSYYRRYGWRAASFASGAGSYAAESGQNYGTAFVTGSSNGWYALTVRQIATRREPSSNAWLLSVDVSGWGGNTTEHYDVEATSNDLSIAPSVYVRYSPFTVSSLHREGIIWTV